MSVAVLRRAAKSGDYPQRFSLLSSPLDQGDLPVAVTAFAERFAAGAVRSDAALMDFLERRPPRLKSRAPPRCDQSGTSMTATSSFKGRLEPEKLFTAAQIALQLLCNGYRVAVASNSHKAINNTLEEIENGAARLKLSFRGASTPLRRVKSGQTEKITS